MLVLLLEGLVKKDNDTNVAEDPASQASLPAPDVAEASLPQASLPTPDMAEASASQASLPSTLGANILGRVKY